MERDNSVLLRQILDSARRIVGKTSGVLKEKYDQDESLRDSIALRTQVIGEAASKLSPAFCARHPEVPWSRVVGMRHRIVHDYVNFNYKVL